VKSYGTPRSLAIRVQGRNKKYTLLIMTEHSPKSYMPSSERVLHMALASSSFFKSVMVFSLRSVRKRSWSRQSGHDHSSQVLLYAINFVRAMLYPLSALFDPIKFVILLVHSFILFKRYKPLFVIASMPPLEIGLSAWLLAKRKTSKLIIDLRDDWESAREVQLGRYFPARIFRALSMVSKKIYSDALVVFVATSTIAYNIGRRGVTTQTLLVPNGADTSIFVPQNESVRKRIRAKYNLPLDKVILVYCGSGTISYYRLDIILSCVKFLPKEVKDKIYVVLYVYSGAKQLKQMLSKLGIADKIVDIRDPLPRKNLAELLRACDVGIVPFDSDAYLLCARSTKLYEYLSSGLYVISSGPKRGELDMFFSANPALGLFIHPTVDDFARSLNHILETTEDLFSDNLRKLRHSFIKRNYDRKSIMETTMKALLER
jgi:glycosyltransferase involved in cell wall biosynthesis